jgi:TP901 family phage tail tape measure protein
MPTQGNILQELWVNVRADISDLKKGFDSAGTEARTFVGNIGQASDELKSVGKTITAISGALVALGALATKTFAEFEQAVANVQSIVGATGNEIGQLTDFAREMGKTTIFTATNAAEAMFFLGQAGFKTNQIMSSLEGTLQLAAATQEDLANTTRVVVSTLNQFQLGAEESSRVANVFAAAIANSLANMERLIESMKFVGPVAFGVGESLESTVAALSKLFDAGITASIAGTQLRQILLRLQAPTKKAREALNSLGLAAEDVNPQFMSLVDIIRTFSEAGAGAIDKGDELAAIFGIRAISPFQVLLREGADALLDLEERITGTNKAAEQAAIQIDTLKGALRLLISALQESAIQIGEALEPALHFLIDALRDLVQVFNELPTGLKTATVLIAAAAGSLGLLIGPLTLLLGFLPQIIAGWGALTAAFSVAAGPIGIITAALLALAGAVIHITGAERRRIEGIKEMAARSKENLQGMREDQKQIRELANRYIELDKAVGDAGVQTDEMKRIVDELNTIQPGLVLSTGDYAQQLVGVKIAAADATEKIVELTAAELRLGEIKVLLDLADAQKRAGEFRREMQNVEGAISNAFSRTVNISEEMQELLSTSDQLIKANTLFTRGLSNGAVSSEKLGGIIRQGLLDEQTRNGFLTDAALLLEDITKKRATIAVLEAAGTKESLIQATHLRGELRNEELVLGVFRDQLEIYQNFITAQQDVIANEKLLMAIREENAKRLSEAADDPKPTVSKAELDQTPFEQAELAIEARQFELRRAAEIEQEIKELKDLAAEEDKQRLEDLIADEEELRQLGIDIVKEAMKEQSAAVKDELQKQKQMLRDLANFAEVSGNAIGQALGESIFEDADLGNIWKTAAKEVIDVMAGLYKKILLMSKIAALSTWPPNLAAVTQAALGIAAISAAQAAAKGLIDSAATGAFIEKSGLLKVHAGETVVPASIARGTREQFHEATAGTSQTPETFGMDEPKGNGGITIGEMHLHNPQVDDRRYWERVMENHLEDVMDEHQNRFNGN